MAVSSAVARFYWSQCGQVQRVLDLGCGGGDMGRYAPPGVTVYGLDGDPRCVERAKAWELAEVCDLDTVQTLPFSDGYFDAVIARDILEHLQKPWLMTREILRVLRPGGVAFASVICEKGRRTWSDYTHVRGFTIGSARLLFEHSGFTVTSVGRMGPVPALGRLGIIGITPHLLAFPPFDWIWTSSYEIRAVRPDAHSAG